MTAGTSLSFSGTLAQTFQTFPDITVPGQSPEPIATTLVDVTQNVTVSTGQSFAGTNGLVGLHSAETDALASGLSTTTSTTDTYESLATPPTNLLDYGMQYADESGNSESTVPAPATILDELPETAGAQWSNGPAATIDEAVAGNASGSPITVVRTVNGDGTYDEKTTYPPNFSAFGVTGVGTIQENADGSGSYVIAADGGYTTITYSPAEPQTTGSPLITIDIYNGTDTTGSPVQTAQIASWYGANPALYAESDRDDGSVAVPSACNLSASLPTQATEIDRSISRTDTILGYTEAQTTQSYVAPGYGVECVIMNDKQTLYYDFNGDQPTIFTSAPPLEITTASETLTLSPTSMIAANVVRRPLAMRDVVAVLGARFDRAVALARRNRTLALAERALAIRTHGAIR